MGARVHDVVESPLGPLTLVWGDGALRGCFVHDQRLRPPSPEFGALARVPELDAVAAQLREYFAGHRRDFDVPIGAEGTPFQRAVWDALAEVGYGTTTSYGALAAAIGRPAAARAVGAANGRNAVSIFVPCHRVVSANGRVVGDGAGARRKRWLQSLERG